MTLCNAKCFKVIYVARVQSCTKWMQQITPCQIVRTRITYSSDAVFVSLSARLCNKSCHKIITTLLQDQFYVVQLTKPEYCSATPINATENNGKITDKLNTRRFVLCVDCIEILAIQKVSHGFWEIMCFHAPHEFCH